MYIRAISEEEPMKILWKVFIRAKIWQDTRGQDFIEYALLAGFLAVTAGATFPTGVTHHVSLIFSKMKSYTNQAATL